MELNVSHDMPTRHGTHRDFIAPWARDVEQRAGGSLRVVVHSGETPLGQGFVSSSLRAVAGQGRKRLA